MPWKERTPMSERERFAAEAVLGEKTMTALCREYGISRKTGYKWLERAQAGECLANRSRTPHTIGNRTPPEIEASILDVRSQHPAWGPRKIGRWMEDRGFGPLPCKSTIANILKRNGCIEPEESLKHTAFKRFQRSRPNDLWQMDFKGQFPMLDSNLCFPLTILDDYSRFSLCLEPLLRINFETFQPVLSRVFQEYGLPRDILCDNGKPWGDSTGGITGFDVWMMQLGILPIHGRPLHPQTQGKDERFHRTLKEEVLRRRAISDVEDAKHIFTAWREMYNTERPHEALGLDVPQQHYRRSKVEYPAVLREPEYPEHAVLRKVNYKGYLSIDRHRYFFSDAMIGKVVRVEDIGEATVRILYGDFQVAKIDLRERIMTSKRIYRLP